MSEGPSSARADSTFLLFTDSTTPFWWWREEGSSADPFCGARTSRNVRAPARGAGATMLAWHSPDADSHISLRVSTRTSHVGNRSRARQNRHLHGTLL